MRYILSILWNPVGKYPECGKKLMIRIPVYNVKLELKDK